MNKADRKRDWLIALTLGAVAFVAYLFTLSRGAYPGEPARLAVQQLGLFPAMSPAQPLWSAACRVARVCLGDGASGLNALSALFGGLSVVWFYIVLADAVRNCLDSGLYTAAQIRTAPRLAGVAGAVFLAFSIPFWTASTRSYPATFDVWLLLVAAWLLLRYAETGASWLAPLLGFVYGAGMVEFATFIIFGPLVGGCLLFLMWQKGELRAATALRLVLAVLVGLSLCFLGAWRFSGSAGYVWREYKGFWHVVWIMWRDQYWLIKHSLPPEGWLLVLLLTAVPWLTALAVARRGLNRESDWTYYLLHAILTALPVAVLLNIKDIATPWIKWGEGDRYFLVTPYVLVASLFGYLVAYWFLLPTAWWAEDEEGARRWARQRLGWFFAAAALALLCVAPVRNFAAADARPAGVVNAYAREVVKTLGERSRLVTDGSLDESLLIAARDLKRPLQLVNFHAAGRAAYMEYVASLFQSQRMTNLAHLGMLPLMQEWFESEPGIEQTAAVMTVPDLWTVAGCQMVPSKMLFLGVRSREALRPEQLLADHERFWNEQIPPLARLAGRDDHLGRLCAYLVQRIAVTANDLGVLLEDMGRQKEAFDVYAKARAIDPENLSALLNQNVMARNGWAPEQTETLKRDLEQSLKKFENQKATLWSLALRYGYVRMPEVAARMGLTWALSGQAGLGVAELKRAADMADDIGKDAVRQLLAGVYLAQQKDEESEAIYRDLLKQNPRHGGALIGLARIEIGRRNLARAESLIGEAEAAGVPRERIVVDRAGLRVAEGKDEAARAMLESLLREKSDNVDAWRLLATILLNRNEDRALEDCLARMQKVSGAAGYAASISAAWAIRRQDWAAARSYTRDALAALPNRVDLMEGLVRIELALGGTQEVAADVRRLLQADPRNAIGNYAMGSLQMRSGETDLAEDSLRTSLKAQRTSAALNDLAWLLCEKGAHKEAEALAREALGTDDKLAPAWDTLGVILMKTGRLPEAQEAVERSLALYQGDAVVFLHMAEMQALKKDFKGARETLDVLYQRANQLSPQDQEKLNSLNRQVDEGRTRGGKG